SGWRRWHAYSGKSSAAGIQDRLASRHRSSLPACPPGRGRSRRWVCGRRRGGECGLPTTPRLQFPGCPCGWLCVTVRTRDAPDSRRRGLTPWLHWPPRSVASVRRAGARPCETSPSARLECSLSISIMLNGHFLSLLLRYLYLFTIPYSKKMMLPGCHALDHRWHPSPARSAPALVPATGCRDSPTVHPLL